MDYAQLTVSFELTWTELLKKKRSGNYPCKQSLIYFWFVDQCGYLPFLMLFWFNHVHFIWFLSQKILCVWGEGTVTEGGETFFFEREGNDDGHDSFEFQFGVGRGLAKQTSETRTPGPRVSALDMPQLTSTHYVGRTRPGHVEQDPDLGSPITQLQS